MVHIIIKKEKRKMKKALSLILTLALIIGLVPAVFAAGEEVECASKTIDFGVTALSGEFESTTDAGTGIHNVFGTKVNKVMVYRNVVWPDDDNDTYYDVSSLTQEFWSYTGTTPSNRHQFKNENSWASGNKTHDLIIKTKAPKAGPAIYKLVIEHFRFDPGGDFEIYLNGKKVADVNTHLAGAGLSADYIATQTSGVAYVAPDANGYLTIEVRPMKSSASASTTALFNIFLKSITIQEVAPSEINSLEYMFTLEDDQVIEDTSKADIYYTRKWGNTTSSTGSGQKEGYIDFKYDMYISTDTWLGNAWVNNFTAYQADGTTVGTLTRYRLADSGTIGNRRITTNVRLPDGIWQLTAVTGACTSGGKKAVYANGVYIGSINDYQETFTSDGAAMALSDVELHSTTLNPIRMTPDANGYVAITVKAYEIIDTSSTTETPTYHNHYIPYSFTFERVEESAYPELSDAQLAVAIKDGVGGSVSIDGVNTITGKEQYVKSVAIGKSVELSATPADGYEFACWEDASGNYVSDADTFDYTVYSNAMVYARFDKIGEDAKVGVEFFNGNGDFLGFIEKTDEENFGDYDAPTASLTGYTFKGWSVADDTAVDSLVRAVALYEEEGNAIDASISVDGTPITGKKYGEEIPCSKAGATSWLRGGKTVAYGESFTHYAFGAATITSSTAAIADKAPVVLLDKIDDAYIIEYDKGGYEILEAGILFGTDEKKTVDGCYYKAKVENVKSHGQFTAKKNPNDANLQTVVRGYVIYKLGNGISVVYSD